MKKEKNKLKRKHCDWYALFKLYKNDVMERDYWLLRTKRPKMSLNRVAYNILKRYYSTIAMRLAREFNSFPYRFNDVLSEEAPFCPEELKKYRL